MRILILSILTLISCGQRDSGSQGQDPEPKLGADKTAQLLATMDDLKECNKDNLGALFYIVDTEQFFFCDEKGWILVNLKGKEGVLGKEGPQGPKGDIGQNGSNGVDGKDARTILSNEWQDPITDKIWFLGRFGGIGAIARTVDLCPFSSHLPENDKEIQGAIDGGIFTKLYSYFDFTGSEFIAIIGTKYDDNASALEKWSVKYVDVQGLTIESHIIEYTQYWGETKAYIVCVKD